MSQETIRDFIYLDIERIRSFVAQVTGGLTSEFTKQAEQQVGGEGGASGGIPILASLTGKATYHYLNSHMETKSLHDRIFHEFYEHMRANKRIADLRQMKTSEWQPSRFRDGAFIEVSGPMKVVDYQATVTTMKAIPELDEAVKRLTQGSTATSLKFRSQYRSLPLKDLGTVFDHFYEGLVRLKVFPFPDQASLVFVGTAYRSAFRFNPTELVNLYGPVIDAGWTTILQVNVGTKHEPASLVSQTGNKIEDAVEQMADLMSGMAELTQGVTFPAVAVTPIAVFREV